MANYYILSESEFCKIFELGKGYRVSKKTLRQYSLYIAGSYLLFNEILAMGGGEMFSISYKKKKVRIGVSIHDIYTWQEFTCPLGTRMKLECTYMNKSAGRWNPFWTYTEFGNDAIQVAKLAYNKFTSLMLKMRSAYLHKYGVEFEWRDMLKEECYLHEPIWLDGVKFSAKLEVKNPGGLFEYIGDYDIHQSITNRQNTTFEGDILKPVMKIIKSIPNEKIQD